MNSKTLSLHHMVFWQKKSNMKSSKYSPNAFAACAIRLWNFFQKYFPSNNLGYPILNWKFWLRITFSIRTTKFLFQSFLFSGYFVITWSFLYFFYLVLISFFYLLIYMVQTIQNFLIFTKFLISICHNFNCKYIHF